MIAAKKKRLMAILAACDRLAVAFSGGVDSTLLLAVAREALGDRVTAVTVDSPLHARREIREALQTAQALGVRHAVVPLSDVAPPELIANPPDRCYLCKKFIFAAIIRTAASMGVARVAHGANLDDLGDYRPGQRAAEELGVLAPLVDAGLAKADIRALARRMRLPTWNKPAMACLASRIPYGRPLTPEVLRMVESAEEALQNLGFDGCRVRHHGPVARIEVARRDLKKAMHPTLRAEILERLKTIGFEHVAVDLEGYVPGSLNRELAGQGAGRSKGRHPEGR